MKLKQKHYTRNGGLLLKQKITSNEGGVERAAKILVAEELERTTDNSNPSKVVGKGRYGTVFKGMLSSGGIVAITKSTLVDKNQVDQFINEVAILSQINHRHIVRLLGCFLETQVPLLVYEFVPNGTLSFQYNLHVRIASEVAGELSYLCLDPFMPIFHRDIKSTSILLDEKYKAKVSDFGISRSAPVDSTHLTTLVQGTFGYLDPEFFYSGQFTDNSDIYSFRIVPVELFAGKPPCLMWEPWFKISPDESETVNWITVNHLKLGAKGDLKKISLGRRFLLTLGEEGGSRFSYKAVILDAKN
ncbi:wall-associated receptor kinase-like 22 [Papaver somniferum]|uniref:wall-associated receptor kinase-like 22 n=1 Tax=Papaver somniferum TaxID=3469 RepID=UPI000E703E36|nr:wall-associated receptor kinase-like 22 [Papaver somniferum]